MPIADTMGRIARVLSQDLVERHSFFQLKHFVVGRECTTQGKLWQCLREVKTRKQSIETHRTEIDEAKDRIELLHIEKEQNEAAFSRGLYQMIGERELRAREKAVKARQIDRKIGSLEASIAVLERKIGEYAEEAEFFLGEFDILSETEAPKPLDDLEAQKEYWTAKLFNEVNIKMLLQQPLDPEVVKIVLALNDDSVLKVEMVRMLESNRQRMVEVKEQRAP